MLIAKGQAAFPITINSILTPPSVINTDNHSGKTILATGLAILKVKISILQLLLTSFFIHATDSFFSQKVFGGICGASVDCHNTLHTSVCVNHMYIFQWWFSTSTIIAGTPRRLCGYLMGRLVNAASVLRDYFFFLTDLNVHLLFQYPGWFL